MSESPAPQEQPSSHSLVSILVISLVCFLFSIGCCYFAIFSLSFRAGLSESAIRHAILQTECLKAIPVRYSVDDSHLFPSHLNTEAHSKWTSALLFVVESQYRAYGVDEGYLKSNEYVLFSGEVFAERAALFHGYPVSYINEHIGKVHDDRVLGLPKNFVQFMSSGRCEASGIAPDGTTMSTLKKTCTPLELVSSQQYSGIRTIKEALWTSGRPLAVALRIPNKRVVVGERVISFPPRSSLLFHHSKGDIELGEYVVMAIVGYNDNFVIEADDGRVYSGGFVLRSGFGVNEHSSDYLLSLLVEEQEKSLCPDFGDVSLWAAASEECIAEDAKVCNATRLVCVNADLCALDKLYIMVNSTTFYCLDDNSYVSIDIPAEYLIHVFNPSEIHPNYERCAYSFMPYEIAQELELLARDAFSFLAFDINLRFKDEGYYEHCKGDCTYISAATHTFNETKRPFPYEDPLHANL